MQTCSKNEQQVVIKIVDFLIINYDIVFSSVLMGYGNFICILIRLILFCNSVFIQIKFKSKTLFSKFCFSNLVIC